MKNREAEEAADMAKAPIKRKADGSTKPGPAAKAKPEANTDTDTNTSADTSGDNKA